MDVHFKHAMELVDHARKDVSPSRALSIYARLHHLQGSDVDHLYQRVLVALGRRADRRPFVADMAEEDLGPETPQSVFGQIRRRLRGRENAELREWVEYHTGRTEAELLWTHVENAHGYVDLLEPFLGVAKAVSVYASDLSLPAARAEIIYYLVLAERSTEPAPTHSKNRESGAIKSVPDELALHSLRKANRQRESRRRTAG